MPWPHALNRNVFNKRLNCSRLWHCLRLIGNKFHSRGPAAAKHRSPKMLDVRRATQVAVSLLIEVGERWRRRRADSPLPGDQVPDRSSTEKPGRRCFLCKDVENLIRPFTTCVRPMLEYRSPVWFPVCTRKSYQSTWICPTVIHKTSTRTPFTYLRRALCQIENKPFGIATPTRWFNSMP